MPEQTLVPVKLQDAGGGFLAVRGVDADVSVDGPVARSALRITFNNDSGRVAEGDLVFPMPAFGALRDLTVKVGSREIKGQFRPRERAQVEYKKAVAAGHTAILGESEGEDFGRLRVAPIEDKEDVEVLVVLESPLLPVTDGYRLVIPTTYMPRYVEDPTKLKETEKAALDRPRPLTLAARATVKVGIRDDLEVRCLSHQATVAKTRCDDDGSTEVLVDKVALDRDVVIEIQDRPDGQNPKVWVRYDATQGPDGKGPTTAVAILAPRFADEGVTIPREVVFLVDRSGSMGGSPMRAAQRAVKGCLRALGPQDRFNIVAFDDEQVALAPASLPFDDKSLAAGDAFVDSIQPGGSTEASEALRVVLQNKAIANVQVKEAPRPSMDHTLRVVIFMTDGDVSGAEAVIKAARADMHDTRMYVVGIGDSVNHAMLAAIAEAGRGTYTPIGADEAIEGAVAAIKSAIDAPLLTGVKVRVEEGDQVRDVSVESVGALDLFAGRPLLFAFRGAITPGTTLILAGQRPDGVDYKVSVPIAIGAHDGAIASTVWALLKNRRLTYRFDAADNATLEELGTTFGVVNSQVALVGVHTDQRNLSAPETIPVVLPMPRNIAEQDQGGALESMTRGVTLGGSSRGVTRGAPVRNLGAVSFSAGSPKGMAVRTASLNCSVDRSDDSYGHQTLGFSMDDLSRSAARQPVTESELRNLLLEQGADGLFGGSYAQTLVVVAALTMRGHTARSGSFRAEMRRTAQTLASRVMTLSGNDLVFAATALAILRATDGNSADLSALPREVAVPLTAIALCDSQATMDAIRTTIAALKDRLTGSASGIYASFVQS